LEDWSKYFSVTTTSTEIPVDIWKKLHAWAGTHISHFAWYSSEKFVCNGSCYFIAFDERLFLATAAHVFDARMQVEQDFGKTPVCRIGHLNFDPEDRLRGYNQELDIVTFEFTYDDLRILETQPIVATHWPPPAPIETVKVILGGFPARGAVTLGKR
jgi:hypothetical protein